MPSPAASDLAETHQLPAFYSPRTAPVDAISGHHSDAAAAHVEDLSLSPADAAVADTPSSQPPPPSLLSPAFTPPATPGTQTPRTRGPRSVPVDSSIPSGGCGTKKPRLLETLPEVQCLVRARIPTVNGTEMFLHLYTNNVDKKEHLAIVFGKHIRSKSLDAPRDGETEMDRMIRGAYTGRLFPGRTTSGMEGSEPNTPVSEPATAKTADAPLVRIHSECYTGETAWSARCDCGEQLDEAARLMGLPDNESGGIIIYLRQEGRGIGLGEKLKAYNLQDLGSDTVEANLLLRHPADARSYGLATAMLLDLGQDSVRLLTNNPDKIRAVEGPNREVVVKERVAMVPLSWRGKGGFRSEEVQGYLKTKNRTIMSFGDIRLRLVIRRHTVPDVKLVWPCSPSDDLTIAKLLGQVNEVVPLEGGEWGLEDYTVELGDGSNGASFECLHFQLVSRILKDEDQVLIRPLLSDDLKRRRRSGRHQISHGGKHLVDGIAFGRPWLHVPGDRPALELPPRKRARIAYGDEDEDDSDSDAGSEFDADWDSKDELEADDAEHASGSSFEDEQGDDDDDDGGDDLLQELELLKKDRRDISEASSESEDVGFGLLPMLDSMAALRMAFPNIPSFIIQQELRRQSQDVRDAYRRLAQSYGPTLTYDEMMDSVLTASRPPNTPVTARLKSLGGNTPAQPATSRPLIEVVESREEKEGGEEGDDEEEEEDASLNESGKVVGLGIRDVDVGFDDQSESDDDTSDSDSDSEDSSGGASYTQVSSLARRGSDDESDDSFSDSDSDSDSDSSSESDSSDGIATAKRRDSVNILISSESDSDSDSSESDSSSSEDSDAGPMEISTSRIQTLSKAVTPPTPSVLVPAVAPGCGLSRTQKRNARRKRSKQMRNSVNGSEALNDSTPDEIMADLEARKAALLSSLASGTLQPEITESQTLEPSTSEPVDKAPTPATNGAGGAHTNGESASPSPRRLNLNAGASKRLLFGALGLRAPKNKADEEKIKQALMKGVKPLTNKRLVEEVEEAAQPDTAMEDDSWRDKINYRAVECCHNGIVLSEPPFPFVQRWDPQQQYNSMRKRKRQSQHYEDYENDVADYDTPARTASHEKNKVQTKDTCTEDALGLSNGHDDADDAAVVEDLPPLPSDLTSLVSLQQDAVAPGNLITWKQLSMSKATNWQPQLASFTGVVLPGSDSNHIKVVLAKRDRESNDHAYDEHTGQRIYEKFEAPVLDDEEEDMEADDGHRTLAWFEMMEPRLIPGSAPAGFVEMAQGADVVEEVSADKSGRPSTGQPETQQSRAEIQGSAEGAADSASSIHSAQRPHHFELPLADDGLMSAASDSLDTGRAAFGAPQPSQEDAAPKSPREGRQEGGAAADQVATGSLSGKPSLDDEAGDTTMDGQDAALRKSTTTGATTKKKKTKKSKATMEALAGSGKGDATTVVPSSLAPRPQNSGENGNEDMAVGDWMAAEHEEAVIPETLVDAGAAVPAAVGGVLDSSPFDSLEDLFVTASSSRPSLEATATKASSLPVLPGGRGNDAEYEEAMRRLDDDESDGEAETLFPNATQPAGAGAGATVKTATAAAAAAALPAVRISPRRQAGAKKEKKKKEWVVPEGSQVITLSSSPARATTTRRSVSLGLHSEDEASRKQRSKLRSRSGERGSY
ncbi:hypothetical protein V2A60_009586 [Cordyceps javanica]